MSLDKANVDEGLAPPLIPSVPYDDAAAAIRWLTDVLGLRVVRKFEMPDGTIAHAELTWRGANSKTPAFPEGSRQFDVRDPEGNLWTVGTYRPRITPESR